jgi:hypothetical protein
MGLLSMISVTTQGRSCNKLKAIQLVLSTTIGIGTGIAMMPIFDKEVQSLDSLGINVDNGTILSSLISINTFILYATSSGIGIYKFLGDNRQLDITEIKQNALTISKLIVVSASVLPLYQLWSIEIADHKYVGDQGFDEFLAWASFSTVPLCISKSIEAYEYAKELIVNENPNNTLYSIGSKIFVYVPSALSFIGRFIIYSESAVTLLKTLGANDTVADISGIIIGGIFGSSCIGIAEFEAIKSLFDKQINPTNLKNTIGAIACITEGLFMTLPVISTGVNFMEEYNPLIKTALLAPLLVTHSVLQSKGLYSTYSSFIDNIFYSNESESINSDLIVNDEETSLIGDMN